MSHHFPALKKTFWQMLGPSIIFAALSLSGGEMLLWPNLVANFGLNILWPVPLILFLQFAVNIEIERYVLVTGKSVESSLVRATPWLGGIFACTVLIALVWPAWITTAGNLLSHLLGFTGEHERNIGLVLSIFLLAMIWLVFRQKSTYRLLEICSRMSLVLALGIILLVTLLNFDAIIFTQGLQGFTSWGYLPENLPRFDFVAALAYGGVAGVLNLVQGEWIKDKGYGVNTLTSKAIHAINFTTPTSVKNFRSWFRAVNFEHLLFFVVANVGSIFLLCYLGAILLPFGSAQGFSVLTAEILALNNHIPYLGTIFGSAGVIIFTMANVTIIDAIGRLMFRMREPLKEHSSPKRKRIFAWLTARHFSHIAILLGIGILASALFFPNFKQPFLLLVISASLSAFTMWIYPPLLLKLNFSLPPQMRPSLFRSAIVLFAALFYGIVTLWALHAYLPTFIIISIGTLVVLYHLSIIVSLFSKNSAGKSSLAVKL